MLNLFQPIASTSENPYCSRQAKDNAIILFDFFKRKLTLKKLPKRLKQIFGNVKGFMDFIDYGLSFLDRITLKSSGTTKLLYTRHYTSSEYTVKMYSTFEENNACSFFLKLIKPNRKPLIYTLSIDTSYPIKLVKNPALFYYEQFLRRVKAFPQNEIQLFICNLDNQELLKLSPSKELQVNDTFRIRRIASGQYEGYYKPLNSSFYTRIDILNSNEYLISNGRLLSREAWSLLDRIQEAYSRIKEKTFTLLEPRVLKANLEKIYLFLLNSPQFIKKLATSKPFIIKKNISGLPYTLNVNLINNVYRLVLNMKTKTNILSKNPLRLIAKTSHNTIKRELRIDSTIEILVDKVSEDTEVEENYLETRFTQLLSTDNPIDSNLINTLQAGKTYVKIRPNGEPVKKKQQFSVAATTDLHELINGFHLYRTHDASTPVLLKNKPKLSQFDKDVITLDILKGLKHIHDQGIVHQDLKPQNILVYQLLDGSWRAKIADFGLAHHPALFNSKSFTATPGYESPEMSLYYKDPSSEHHHCFHQINYVKKHSLGHLFSTHQPKLCHIVENSPCQSNDIWSLGIVLFFLNRERSICANRIRHDLAWIRGHYLIDKMLNLNPVGRIKINQALQLHEEYMSNKAMNELPHLLECLNIEEMPSSSSNEDSPSNLSDEEIEYLVSHTGNQYDTLTSLQKQRFLYILVQCYKMDPLLFDYVAKSLRKTALEELSGMFLEGAEFKNLLNSVIADRNYLIEQFKCQDEPSIQLYDEYISDVAYDNLLIYLQINAKSSLRL